MSYFTGNDPPLSNDELAELRARWADKHASATHRIQVLEGTRIEEQIRAERAAQDAKFGPQNHPDGTGDLVDQVHAGRAREACKLKAEHGMTNWRDILAEEVYEAFAEDDPVLLRAELVQVAAVTVAWIEAIDRRPAVAEPECDGLCVTASDVGVAVAGNPVAYPHPGCPQHCGARHDVSVEADRG